MCILPIWIPPLCLFFITIGICKNIMAQSIRANTIGKLHIPKLYECCSNILVCHNVTQVYLLASNIKFFTINLSCGISLRVLHDKKTNMDNYWSCHKTWA
jgi:hypothetical protein